MFAGILGPAQELDFVLTVAEHVQDLPGVCFLFVGDGTEKQHLQKIVVEKRLRNVRFEPFVSLDAYPSLVKEADGGLLCLGMKNKTAAVPGKLFGLMAAALPVLAFLNKESDGHRIITEAQCGVVLLSNDSVKAANVIREIVADKVRLVVWGKNGYAYAAAHFGKDACIDRIASLLS